MKKRVAWSLAVGLLAFGAILGVSVFTYPLDWSSRLILAGCGWFVISIAFFMTNRNVKKMEKLHNCEVILARKFPL